MTPHAYNNLVNFYLTTKIFTRNNVYVKTTFAGSASYIINCCKLNWEHFKNFFRKILLWQLKRINHFKKEKLLMMCTEQNENNLSIHKRNIGEKNSVR